ncbi:hypothetical protein [Pectobacterium brasiliense]|nr:hypothetical protein [Pectobacterium brasiliense]
MKKILCWVGIPLMALFLLKSCISEKDACGYNEKDVLRSACEKEISKS